MEQNQLVKLSSFDKKLETFETAIDILRIVLNYYDIKLEKNLDNEIYICDEEGFIEEMSDYVPYVQE